MNKHRIRPALTILGIRPTAYVELYRWRLSEHRAQELLAGSGIAVGIALFFGVLVANSSLLGSASELAHSVAGRARLQLMARSPEGFDQRVAQQAADLPGVQSAVPVLRENAVVVGSRARESVQLIGVTPRQTSLEATSTRNLGSGALALAGGLGLPASVASHLGIQGGEHVRLLTAGQERTVQVRMVLGTQTVGPIANSPVIVSLLGLAQQLTGERGRITQVFVVPKHGADHQVERELRQLAHGRLDVQATTHELDVLRATSTPTSQSTALFAAISAMVGFLLALNAVLLTVPERRRFVVDLRQQGFGPHQILLILISQAVTLGVAASVLGVLLGEVLSRTLFHEVPSYIALAFPIGSQPVIPAGTIALAIGCGVLATTIASILPVLELHRRKPSEGRTMETRETGRDLGGRTAPLAGGLAFLLILAVTVVVLAIPDLSIAGGVVLAAATFCLVPWLFTMIVRALTPVGERIRGSMFSLAMVELQSTATRSVALAGVAALAVYGMVAVQGARQDLIHGLDAAVVQYLDTADVWVTTDNNFLTINSFSPTGKVTAIAKAPGIASVREYDGQLLDVGTRRLWLRARPSGDQELIQASQILQGELAQASRLVRTGGWAVISNGFAEERHLHVGDSFTLPAPTGQAPLRVAAITTNVGWPPGAVTLNSSDYRRYWGNPHPTALEVNLKPGTTPAEGKRKIENILGHQSGLLVETFAERRQSYEESARQGIKSLSDISSLLLIASSLAIASALSAAIWQRRARLASLKSHGFDSRQLWSCLLQESFILISIGCADGALLGVYGHALASRWLKLSIGFPAPFSLALGLVILTLVVIICVALAVIALPGLLAARVPPRASFQE